MFLEDEMYALQKIEDEDCGLEKMFWSRVYQKLSKITNPMHMDKNMLH